MSIWRFITIIGLLGCGWAFQAQAEDAGVFKVPLPLDREAIITPNLKKLKEWNIALADFQREVTVAVKDEFAYNKYSNVDTVVFRKEYTIGERGRREYLINIEHKVGQYASIEVKKLE